MNLKEIAVSANGLGGQVKAGVPLDDALDRMRVIQPEYEEFWLRAAIAVRNGRPLSECLHEIWPLPLVRAVQAGEQAGKLKDVFERIKSSLAVEQELRGTIGKLAYPLGMMVAGMLVSMGFLIFVIPNMVKAMSSQRAKSLILSFSVSLSEFVMANWPVILIALAVGIFMFLSWVKSEQGKAAILDFALGVPMIREALRDLYFGLWAYYMEMTVSAGIPTTVALTLTAPILPDRMRESIEVFDADMTRNNRPMGKAADLAKQEPGDPRREWWPFYISNAFILAEQSGLVDEELRQCAPVLIEDGTRTLERVVFVANIIAIAGAALMILAPIGAYYSELFDAARTMGR